MIQIYARFVLHALWILSEIIYFLFSVSARNKKGVTIWHIVVIILVQDIPCDAYHITCILPNPCTAGTVYMFSSLS